LFSSPVILVSKYPVSGINLIDICAASLMLVFIIIETIADNQQFRFQRLKRQSQKAGRRYSESLKNGFLSEGLWGYVRHPNFIAEQCIWVSFYFFGVAATGIWINWTLAGPLLLTLLFLGSTRMTENISSGKYPGYAAYRKDVPKFIPGLIRKKAEVKTIIEIDEQNNPLHGFK
jgi:steroid 5-alpha reductase family enzyme